MRCQEGGSRLLLVDDHPIVREGLHSILCTEPTLSIVGEASSGEEALELIRERNPHMVITDIRMPGMDGIELTRHIRAEFPETAVIVLTMYENETYLLEALCAGASGYLMKDSSRAHLCQAITTTIGGGTVVDSSLMQRVVQRLGNFTGEQY